jgi:hypothetical protein
VGRIRWVIILSFLCFFPLFSSNLPKASADGVGYIYIRADGSIDPSTAPIQHNTDYYVLTQDIYGKSIVVQKDNIVIDGKGHSMTGPETTDSAAMNLSSRQGVTVENLKISGFGYLVAAEGSHENRIFHNNFLDQPNRILGGANSWDNGIEGNYWGDRQSQDDFSGAFQNITGSDGIADAPITLDEDNRDYYPLMGNYSVHNVTKQSEEYNISAISDSNITSVTYDLSHKIILQISNNSENLEFCRVDIPKALLAPPYTILIDDGQTPIAYYNDNLADNGTDRWIYFSYQHSNHLVTIIPEFSAVITLLLLLSSLPVLIISLKLKLKRAKHF